MDSRFTEPFSSAVSNLPRKTAQEVFEAAVERVMAELHIPDDGKREQLAAIAQDQLVNIIKANLPGDLRELLRSRQRASHPEQLRQIEDAIRREWEKYTDAIGSSWIWVMKI